MFYELKIVLVICDYELEFLKYRFEILVLGKVGYFMCVIFVFKKFILVFKLYILNDRFKVNGNLS